ncbi:DMT family transporter [Bariatricus sp. SGI.154]|uniref:DMT family transporter n=1 Tax=Bariatricus sp. SGI.154 TaxID=3420549 RepID=UPI003CFE075E
MKKDTHILKKPLVVCAVALLCCTLWGSAFPSIKIGYRLFGIQGEDTMSQMLFAGYRFTLAGVMVILIGSFLKKSFMRPKSSSWFMVIKLGAVQTIFQYVFFYMGLAHTTGVKSSIITASNVFLAIFLSVLVFRERLSVGKFLGCLVGFAGVILINLTGGKMDMNLSLAGEGSMLVSAFASALSSVMIKGYSSREDTFTLCGYQFFFGGIVLSMIGWICGGRVTGFTGVSTLLLIYMGLISAVAYSLWSILLKYNPVGKVAVFGFANPIIGVILSALLLGEKNQAFTLKGLVALLLVCIGIVMVNRGEK